MIQYTIAFKKLLVLERCINVCHSFRESSAVCMWNIHSLMGIRSLNTGKRTAEQKKE